MLPQQSDESAPGHDDDLGTAGDLDLGTYAELVPEWNFTALGPPCDWSVGETISDPTRDVIQGATALVRLTHNLAMIHRDAEESPYPERLVYGGHVVGLAQASLSRVLPGMATVVGWHLCDHTGPAFEGDLLSFRHTLLDVQPCGPATPMRSMSKASLTAPTAPRFSTGSRSPPHPEQPRIADLTRSSEYPLSMHVT